MNLIVENTTINENKENLYYRFFIAIGEKRYQLFYSMNKKMSSYIVNDESPTLAVAILAAMKKNIAIDIKGSVSNKLLKNIDTYKNIINNWNIGCKNIEIKPTKNVYDKFTGKNIGLFFSGGVDSFAAYIRWNLTHKDKITHFIFVHGFDIDIKQEKIFRDVLNKIRQVASKEKVKLIVIKTNLREFTDKYIGWGYAHGPALASIALLIRKKFKKIIIPSTNSKNQLFPWGSHPDTDKLWSTETMKIIHDHNDLNRLQKIQKYISRSNTALKYLRVCWKNVEYNCCECDKCLRTMIELKIAGVFDKAISFKKPINLNLIERINSNGPGSWLHLEDCLNELKKQNLYPDIQMALQKSIYKSKNPNLKRKLYNLIHDIDSKYYQQRLFKLLSFIKYFINKRMTNIRNFNFAK